MKKSLFLKLLIGFLIPTILLPSLLLISYFSLTRSYLINELYGKLQGIGIVIKQVILPILEENNKDKLKDLTQNFSAQIGIRITIIQSDGVVIDDSEKNPNDMENHKDRPEIIQAMQNKIGKSMRYSPTLKRDMLYLALPIRITTIIYIFCVIVCFL
jgi:two-component system phosphate regulon sensor histidine kinase PhoR